MNYLLSYGNRAPDAYREKWALETAVIHGGLVCGQLPPDDQKYVACSKIQAPDPFVDFIQVRDVNEWWHWLETTVKSQVRVQPWYNGKPPFGLRGYLDDRVNRIIGYAIVRQIREERGTCR